METYHLRLTTELDYDRIEEFIQSVTQKYILAHEDGHYHAVILINKKEKSAIKERINKELDIHGNKGYSMTLAKSINDLSAYVTKDGDIRYLGYTFLEISAFKKMSYKKGGMSDEIKELERKYVMDELNDSEFGISYINLLVRYDKNLHGNQIKAYLLKMRVKKNPGSSRDIYENLMRFI